MPSRPPGSLVLFGLLAVATAWLCASVPVFSQEAYYWTYAQHPDLSYFDHPPMVAWLIWLGTQLFGDGAVGVRMGTWLCGMATTWVGWLWLRDLGVDHVGRAVWVGLGVASPILVMTHFLANPDAPLVCFWTLTMFALWRARSAGQGWWILAGAAAGAALLSKYSAGFLAMGGITVLAADSRMRRHLRGPGPWLAVLVAGLMFLPVVIWNANNHFESFRFQTSDRFARASLGGSHLAELVFGQIGILHPVLAVLLPAALWWLVRRSRARDPRALWLLAFGLPLPVYLLINSLWIEVKINWLAPALVPLLMGLIVWWRESDVAIRNPRVVRWVGSSLLLVPLVLPLAPLLRLVPPGRGSSWVGWEEIAAKAEAWEDRVDEVDGIEGNIFFFAADYRDAAQLGRNLRMQWDREGIHQVMAGFPDSGEPTMAQNVISKPALQFDHWNAPADRIGQDAIFVLPRPRQREAMVDQARRHFASIERVEQMQIHRLGIHVLDADVYVCRDYRGPDAPTTR
jgi:4-amino-4-deoxy-L-arabinose transferase-like glycosyltransferase